MLPCIPPRNFITFVEQLYSKSISTALWVVHAFWDISKFASFMSEEQMYRVALGLTSGVGDKLTKILVSYCGSATEVFKTKRGKLLKIPGVGPKTADALLSKQTLLEAEEECTKAEKEGALMLFFTDTDYPQRLKTIDDAPTLLYLKGNANVNAQKIVAIVGTRSATSYGKKITEEIVEGLSHFDSMLIVSGLAYGIDITTHKAALKYTVPTLGVMAAGVDVVYPAAHKGIAGQMLAEGGLLTEYPMGTKPEAPYFPARNRIIAGLADALIVVEAAIKGGALITADIANSYNKDIFAVPGNVGSTYSEGCNRLIQTHKAGIFTSVQDMVFMMNWEKKGLPKAPPLLDLSALSEEEKLVVSLLQQNKEMLIDELSWKSQVPVSLLASLLLGLELQGMIKSMPGKKYTLAQNR
ncbi:DNA-processing protein DprA [Rhodocytophaga aerolata]